MHKDKNQMSRKSDRKQVFFLVFQMQFLKETPPQEIFETYLKTLEHPEKRQLDFIKSEFFGTHRHKERIDRIISKAAKGWDVSRLATVDLAILRLAVFELVFTKNIPPKAVINEAITLAKLFSSEESPSFINGILGRVALEVQKRDNAKTNQKELESEMENELQKEANEEHQE